MISGVPGGNYPTYQQPYAGQPQAYAAPPSAAPGAAPQSETAVQVANVLTSIWNGLVNLVKGFFGWLGKLFNGGAANTPAQPVPTSPYPTPVPGSALTPDEAAMAQQYKLYPTKENIAAFTNEVRSYQQSGALGPGVQNPGAIRDLQTALSRLGYQVPATGEYDAATAQAVMRFKRDNSLRQTYLAADGQPAINEYADAKTLQAILQRLQGQVPTPSPVPTPAPVPTPVPPTPVPPTPGPIPTPPVPTTVTPPAPQPQPTPGSIDYGAIAQRYGLQADPANVQQFLTEVKGYQQHGALGPGSDQTTAIRDLQTALGRLGYQVPATGQYDAATSQAIMAFKRANGLHQTYRAADGNWAVNEYADQTTLGLILQKLQQQPAQPAPAPAPAPAPQPPAQPVPTPGGVDYGAIASRYGLLNSPENVQAFLNEVKMYETQGALGPGYPQTSAIKDLQTALSRLGYQVPATGQYDQATAQAVIAFKRANGLRQNYKAADGNWAVNEYADAATMQRIMQMLQQTLSPQAPAPVPPAPPAPAPAPPVAPPVTSSYGNSDGGWKSPVSDGGNAYQAPQPAAPSQQPVYQAPVQAPAGPALDPQSAALAQQYNLLATPDNLAAFRAEVGSYPTDGSLGPGSTQTAAIKDLQTVLARFGYPVQPSGQYDQATAQAVIQFKRASGIHQNYRAADGNWAVNEYADRRTLETAMAQLQRMMGRAG
jgi:N-acetyl-anhydromuramyl-L-alanine amidase AmpD